MNTGQGREKVCLSLLALSAVLLFGNGEQRNLNLLVDCTLSCLHTAPWHAHTGQGSLVALLWYVWAGGLGRKGKGFRVGYGSRVTSILEEGTKNR